MKKFFFLIQSFYFIGCIVISSDANLGNLTISQGSLNPAFNQDVLQYTVEVQNAISSITVTPTAKNEKAAITVNGISVNSGTESPSIELAIGHNAIAIIVTAEDGKTVKTYTLDINRLPENPEIWRSEDSFSEGEHLLGSNNAGLVTIQFDLIPLYSPTEGIVCYADSSTTVTTYSDCNMLVRIFTNGYFDVRNGSNYNSLTNVPYSASMEYHIKIIANLPQKIYDVWVTPQGGSEIKIAENYAFRTNAPEMNDVGKVSLVSEDGNGNFIENQYIVKNHMVTSQNPSNDPEINVQHNSNNITNGGNYSFGKVYIQNTSASTFTIENKGNSVLTLNQPIEISGANSSEFSISTMPATSIAPGNSTAFTIGFTPKSTGIKNAILTIWSNDPDEGIFVINLTGEGSTPGSHPFQIETLSEIPNYDDNGIFVATDGIDAPNRGTITAPYKTIQYVLNNVAVSGNTIIVRGGTYNEQIRIRRPNITIRSKSGEMARIQLSTSDSNATSVVIIDVDADGAKLQRLELVGGYYYAVQLFTRFDWGDPNDRTGVSQVTIEDCIVHDTGRDGIKITPGCDDVTIRRTEIYNTGVRDNSNADGIDNVNADRMRVQECYIHNTATNGLYFKGGATDCLVERTMVTNCGSGGIFIGFDTSPEYFDLSVNPEYYEAINGIVRNCLVVNTKYAGIALYAARDCQVYNNTIVNTALNAHSPIYFGITLQDWVEEAGRPASINPIIKNNLVYQSGSYTNTFVFIRYLDELGGLSALDGMPTMSNNSYYHTSGAGIFEDRRPGFDFIGNLLQWQNHISSDINSFEGDPLLRANYRLLAGSPCIDAGEKISYVSYDIDKELRIGIYDIGADEWK